MSVRTPFQLFKLDRPEGTIGEFNSLPPAESLKYKIAAAQSKLQSLLGSPSEQATMSNQSKASVAKGLYDLLNIVASLQSAAAPAGSIDNDVVGSALTLIGLGSDTPLGDEAQVQQAAQKVKEVETSLKKQARSDPLDDQLLRKSARIQEQREAAQATPDVIEVPRPTVKATKAIHVDEPQVHAVINVDSGSHSSLVVPLENIPELSCAISVMSEGAVNSTEEPAPRPPALDKPKKAPRREKAAENTEAGAGGGDKPVRAQKQQRTLFQERRPALIGSEKKVIRGLEEMILNMAAVYAKKDNQLLPLFDGFREATQLMIAHVDKELTSNYPVETRDITKPVPFHGLDLVSILDAINASAKRFDANDDECRSEFDEYLLHPIAHRVMTAINALEGFQSQPERVLSEKEIEARKAAREAERTKREDAAQKQLQKIREREEAAAKKEEEKKILRNLSKALDLDQLVEDTEIPYPSELGFVQYASLPLSLDHYEQALQVWAMIVSVPRALLLSQCPFSLFVTALKENKSENGLMEEIFRSLNDINVPHANAILAPQGTPKINTRGRDWFSLVIEFINLTSGVKKVVRDKKKKQAESSEDESSDDSDDSSDESDEDNDEEDDENSEASNSGDGSNEEEDAATNEKEPEKPAAVPVDPDAHLSPQEKKLKTTMEAIAELRNYASWGNIDVGDRLNILQYCVNYALESDTVSEEADRLRKTGIEEQQAYDKKINDARQEGEKEIRALAKLEAQSKKPVAVGAEAPKPVDFAKKKAQIVANMEALIREARINKFTKADQEDRGARIVPLGQDRYRRLYWRMPLDKSVLVQTVHSITSAFPVYDVAPPLKLPNESDEAAAKRLSILVDEEEPAPPPKKRGRAETASNTTTPALSEVEIVEMKQSSWGVITSEYLPQFVGSLDQRGRREGPLKLALQPLEEYLKHLEAPTEGVRMTRSRAAAHGYLNKLRAF